MYGYYQGERLEELMKYLWEYGKQQRKKRSRF